MTNLIRYTPSNDVRRLQREMDRFFETFMGDGAESDSDSAVWTPRVDLSESEDAYHIHLELPGIPKDGIEINYHNNVLSVSGERTAAERDEQQQYVRIERSYGRFYRSFTLPKAADTDAIDASYEDGVLHVRVKKAEDRKPRRISIA